MRRFAAFVLAAAVAALFFLLALTLLVGTMAHAAPARIVCDTSLCRDVAPGSNSAVARLRTRGKTKSSSWGNVVAVLPHPKGCPRTQFCGCGVAVAIFGRPIRALWLAAEWLRRFPRARPAPGRVAVRRDKHHVFEIRKVYEDGSVLAADYNSGGHRSRLWRRSLSGFIVVDPRGG